MAQPPVAHFAKSLFLLVLVLGVAWWVGAIWQASGENKLTKSCLPFQWVTDGLHRVSSLVAGHETTWTLQTQAKVLSSCYYVAATVIPDKEVSAAGVAK